jgi:septum site-determining protein MinD
VICLSARVIAVLSGKGGTGKTTITANLGIALAGLGKKVLLIDADIAMANLSLLLGMQSSPITLHDVLLGESKIRDAIYDGPNGVHFIPSGLSLDTYKRVDSERLSNIISQISDSYDIILLDSAAGIEKNVLSAISAAQESLLVTMPTSPAIADALKARLVAQRLGSNIIGVVINFVMNESGEIPKQKILTMLEVPWIGSVPYDPEVRRSFMQDKVLPVILKNPSAPASIEIRNIASRLVGAKTIESVVQKKGFFDMLFGIFKRK